LDLPVEAGLSRIRGPDGGRDGLDRIESEGRAFHEAVRRGFLALATAEPARVRLVDASGPMAVVHKHIMEIVDRVLR
jgi:dTMP kinase